MKSLRQLPHVALFVIVTFVSFVTSGPLLSGCGGGSSDSSSSVQYDAVQTETSDSSGKVTFTVLGNSVELTLADSAGRALSGLSVDYVQASDDSEGLFTIYDANNVYETSLIRAVDSAADLSLVGTTLDGRKIHVDQAVVVASALYIAATVLVAYSAYSLAKGVYKLSGDPPNLSYYGDKSAVCISPDQFFTTLGIGADAVGLLTAGSPRAIAAGAAAAKVGAWKLLGDELVDIGLGEASDSFFTEVLASYDYEAGTEYCVYLWENLMRTSLAMSGIFTQAVDLTPYPCVDGACPGSATATPSPAAATFDADNDGYTPDEDDCDDNNKWINPGAIEICGNDVDEDCSGSAESCTPGLTIAIASPGYEEGTCGGTFTDGICYGIDRALLTTATVTGGTNPTSAYILVNGRAPQISSIEGGITMSGNYGILKCSSSGVINSFGVVVADGTNYGVDEIFYGCNAAATELLIMLTWDTADTELYLYVKEPGGEYAFNGGATTSTGGSITDNSFAGGYGPAFYTIGSNAASEEYQFRVHFQSGTGTTNYTLTVVPQENFDHAYVTTGQLITSNAAAGGTANFTSTDSSWSSATWSATKSSASDSGWTTVSTE